MEYQPELFDNSYKNKKLKKNKFNKHLFNRRGVRFSLSYEQIGLLIIFSIILLSIVFTLGVERGKVLNEVNIVDEKNVQKSKVENEKIPVKDKIKKQKISKNIEKKEYKGVYYTIQVVTYRKQSLANDEVSYLQKKEYEAFIIDAGKFKHVCVGRFKNREEAKSKLKKLRKKYKDCFVKKVK